MWLWAANSHLVHHLPNDVNSDNVECNMDDLQKWDQVNRDTSGCTTTRPAQHSTKAMPTYWGQWQLVAQDGPWPIVFSCYPCACLNLFSVGRQCPHPQLEGEAKPLIALGWPCWSHHHGLPPSVVPPVVIGLNMLAMGMAFVLHWAGLLVVCPGVSLLTWSHSCRSSVLHSTLLLFASLGRWWTRCESATHNHILVMHNPGKSKIEVHNFPFNEWT